jgi:hypothetical protein
VPISTFRNLLGSGRRTDQVAAGYQAALGSNYFSFAGFSLGGSMAWRRHAAAILSQRSLMSASVEEAATKRTSAATAYCHF